MTCRWVACAIGTALLVGPASAAAWVFAVWLTLPSIEPLGAAGDPGLGEHAKTYCADTPAHHYRPLAEIDPRLACAVVWSEDGRFFRHDGVDWTALRAAARVNWQARGLRMGAGTIAMQVARFQVLPQERTFTRKLAEILLAHRLVERFGRGRVLELYLNVAPWAPCTYGAEAAAQHYLGHGAERTSWAEAVFLATLFPDALTPPWPAVADVAQARARLPLLRRQRVLLEWIADARRLDPRVRAAETEALARLWSRPGARAVSSIDASRPVGLLAQACAQPLAHADAIP